MIEFEAFPKIRRAYQQRCTITEKLDGTNAQIAIGEDGSFLVGSRKREIWPEGTEGKGKGCDNFAFAQWAYGHKAWLVEFLGPGRHFGEWVGPGIGRGYGLQSKRFCLFNTRRWGPGRQEIPDHLTNIGLSVVPLLYEGLYTNATTEETMIDLRIKGSRLNNFDNPEGIIVYLHGLDVLYKDTFEYRHGKWLQQYPK